VNQKRIVGNIIFPLLLLFWGCSDSSLPLQVRYADVLGLQQGDSVYFGQNEIGKVQKVTYTQQGDYLVAITIAPEFKNAATVDSKFFIDDDPRNRQRRAITIVQEKPGGGVLEKTTIIEGSVRAGFLDQMLSGIKRNAAAVETEMWAAMQQLDNALKAKAQQLDNEMAAALDDLTRRLQTLSTEVEKVPDSQEVKQLEMSIKQFADEFSRAQKSVRDTIQNEVIPQLRRELDQLRQQLHQEGRDKEIEEIDKQVEQMIRV
jgi:ABC-type transporter Mla subunit MlaD